MAHKGLTHEGLAHKDKITGRRRGGTGAGPYKQAQDPKWWDNGHSGDDMDTRWAPGRRHTGVHGDMAVATGCEAV